MQREGERVRKECEMRRRGRGRRCWRRVRVQRGQVVFVCVGWGRKWVRLVFLFMALMPAVQIGNAPAGAGKEVLETGSCPKGASGFRLCGLGAKMGSFGILVHGFDAGGATRGGTARSASRNSTGRGSSPK